MASTETIALAGVGKHNKPGDLWVVINNKNHPGGVAVLNEVGGFDATEAFAKEHVETLKVFRPTYLDVGQEAAVKVTKKGKSKARRSALPSLAVAVILGAGAASWAGKPCALALRYLPTSLISESGGRYSLFWWGVGIATVAEVTATVAAAMWAWSKLDIQEEFTHWPAHHTARPSQYVPILNVPTISGSSRGSTAPKTISVIDPQEWRKFKLVRKTPISPNVYRIVFALPNVQQQRPRPHRAAHQGLRQGRHAKHLEPMFIGDAIDIRGPKGSVRCEANSYAKHIGMIAGGTGIAPMFQMIRAICEDESDSTTMSLLYASNSDKTSSFWTGLSGFVNAEMIKEYLPVASDDTKVLLCGPPPMVNAMTKNLLSLGFKQPGAMSQATDQVFLF
ncbi:hypothetical protein QBC44DRAFT_341388 [Cladorrhinum sp. PSN332]|nr:hypothetical protein QBC44DRAFT_341388 [Cladorrhinum sp. PSN332]